VQTGFLVVILAGKSQVVFKGVAVAVGVFVGQGGAEGIGGVPAPDGDVGIVQDDSGRVCDVVAITRNG